MRKDIDLQNPLYDFKCNPTIDTEIKNLTTTSTYILNKKK